MMMHNEKSTFPHWCLALILQGGGLGCHGSIRTLSATRRARLSQCMFSPRFGQESFQ